ncbi:hypothetical protein NKH77_49305 [Streptomyces sp. M19]
MPPPGCGPAPPHHGPAARRRRRRPGRRPCHDRGPRRPRDRARRARLTGELTRTTYQLRLFAEAVREGGLLEATIDHAADTPWGPGPTCAGCWCRSGPSRSSPRATSRWRSPSPGRHGRRLAAGCPVVVKAHPRTRPPPTVCTRRRVPRSPPRARPGVLSPSTGRRRYGPGAAPGRTRGGVHRLARGRPGAGRPRGRTPGPHPFYGELGSVNPVLVTEDAAVQRPDALAEGLTGSVLQGGGQFCTQPGLVLLPAGPAGDRVADAMARRVAASAPVVLLDQRIRDGYEREAAARADRAATGLRQTAVAEGAARTRRPYVPGSSRSTPRTSPRSTPRSASARRACWFATATRPTSVASSPRSPAP